jgi:hypothetical protein
VAKSASAFVTLPLSSITRGVLSDEEDILSILNVPADSSISFKFRVKVPEI